MEAKKRKSKIQVSVFLKLSEIIQIIKLFSYYYKILVISKIIILSKPWKIWCKSWNSSVIIKEMTKWELFKWKARQSQIIKNQVLMKAILTGLKSVF